MTICKAYSRKHRPARINRLDAYRQLYVACLGSFVTMSFYTGNLSSASSAFNRPYSVVGNFYYQALQVTIPISGTYTFTSTSTMDTYGYIYTNALDPSNPFENLITSDDSSGGHSQFLLTVYLSSSSSYVLIVTTFIANSVGSFSVTAAGPTEIDLTPFTQIGESILFPEFPRNHLILVSSYFFSVVWYRCALQE